MLTIFNSLLENSTLSDFLKYFLLIFISLGEGFILALVYKYYRKSRGFSLDMPITLIVLPIVISAISMLTRLIGLNESDSRTTLGFSIVGILAITRFRSEPKDALDLSFITISIFISFINGLGYIYLALITFAIAIACILIVHLTQFSIPSSKEMNLKINIPEDMNFDNIFNDILDDYCTVYNLKSVKTIDFGTLYELNYVVTLKDANKQKEFIDKIRERNSNLTISLSVRRFNSTI